MKKRAIGRSPIIGHCPIGAAYEAFMLRCQAQNLSPLTCVWYRQLLKLFQRFLDRHGLTLAREVSPTFLRAYLTHMRHNGNASGTVARTYGGLRCFFGFLARERLIPQNPMSLVEKPRMERKLIQPLTMEQVRLLLAQPKQKCFMSQRTWTLMIMILDTGLRISEVFGLRLDQVDLHRNVLRVMGKGGREREVPMGTTAKQALWKYLSRRGEVPGQELAFVSRFGHKLDRGTVGKAFRAIGRRAGIKGVRVSPHTLRHTFATRYIMNGGDAFSLQQILGHSSLEMVKIYVKLANRDIALQHRRFSPLDNMGIVPGSKKRVVVH